MTLEPVEDRERTPEELMAARLRSYRQIANGLLIHTSRYLGIFDIERLDPSTMADWAKLATELHSEVDAAEVSTMTERRRKYLETIRAPLQH